MGRASVRPGTMHGFLNSCMKIGGCHSLLLIGFFLGCCFKDQFSYIVSGGCLAFAGWGFLLPFFGLFHRNQKFPPTQRLEEKTAAT